MQTTSLVVDTPLLIDGTPVKMAVKQYTLRWPGDTSGGMTLVFAHGVAAYKEMWEPVIETLFQYQAARSKRRLIREVWSLEWPSHGESAVLNENILRSSGMIIGTEHWAKAISDFVRKHLASHRVLCIGHSSGVYAMLNSTRSFFTAHSVSYESIVLVEPGIIHRHVFQEHKQPRERQISMVAELARKRRQEWPSRNEAFSYLMQRAPWSSWDTRVLRLYAEYGLRPADADESSVTLKCSAHTMAEAFSVVEIEQSIQAMEQVEALCDCIPIHVIFGEYNDAIPQYYKDCFSDLENRSKVASVTVLPDVGHSIPQEKPDSLAESLWLIVLRHDSQPQLGSYDQPSGTAQPYQSRL